MCRLKRIPFSDCLPKLLIFFILGLSSLPLEAGQDPAQIHFLHALKSKQEGDLFEAERLFRKAIELDPGNADYHFELGNLHLEKENLAGARLELEQAVMIAPAHVPAHFNLGLAYRELGLMSEARAEFRKVLELDPQNLNAQLQIGYTYQAEGFFDDARQAFEEAGKMDLANPEPQRALDDLAEYELEAAQRSHQMAEQSMVQNQSLLELLARGGAPLTEDNGREKNQF